MSAAPERVKQSTEKRTLSFDFTTKVKAGDTVASINTVVGAGLTLGSPSLLSNVVSVQVSGGTNGTRYPMTCNVTTTPGGDILELDCTVYIVDTEN